MKEILKDENNGYCLQPRSVSSDCNLVKPTYEMIVKKKYKKVPRIIPTLEESIKMELILNS
ncbi:MAG: hypothetical protein JXR69_01345 [Candidatus Delongbacteria bacterium]|nr:hypothetical protein [Candidatus Delongbacteria bacterium]